MRTLLICDSIDDSVLTHANRLTISEITCTIPKRYQELLTDKSIPLILIEEGDDILDIVEIDDLTTFTYDFDSVVIPVRSQPTTLQETLAQLQSQINILKGE
jgi:hypothetical protein